MIPLANRIVKQDRIRVWLAAGSKRFTRRTERSPSSPIPAPPICKTHPYADRVGYNTPLPPVFLSSQSNYVVCVLVSANFFPVRSDCPTGFFCGVPPIYAQPPFGSAYRHENDPLLEIFLDRHPQRRKYRFRSAESSFGV